jgi:branched-chain amino acid transport system ATP-binding protein
VALDSVCLSFTRDEVLGLIGPNGAGKTTLVNVLTGFQKPNAGRVLIEKEDVTGWPPYRLARRGLSRSFQTGRLFRDLLVVENLEAAVIGMGQYRAEARRRALELLEWIGLADKAFVRADTLPYGDERRVGIARALVVRPHFVLLDEPAAGLNDIECEELMRNIASIPSQFGAGVLLIEHNMRVVVGVSDRIHVLESGRTIAIGQPSQIQHHPDVIRAYLGTNRTDSAIAAHL